MKIKFLDLKKQQSLIQDDLSHLAAEIIEKGWYIGGSYVERFENDFAAYLGAKYCVSCGNGTDALELILKGYNIGAGDEVIVPSFTWVSDAEAVHAVGATPVLVDIDRHGYNISSATIESRITPKTKAIIVVHLYGIPCDMESIMLLSRKYGIKVIEDCAQAHGATWAGKKAGTIGDAGSFSFYPTKNLGALGDGGAVTTNDENLAKSIQLIKDHGQESRDNHILIGRNSRLDTMQAAFLSLKLPYLDEWNLERERLAQIYLQGLEGLDLILPVNNPERVFHLFVIQTQLRDQIKQYLNKHGIETAIHYPNPIHSIQIYSLGYTLPNSERAASEVLSLPLYRGLQDKEVEYVIKIIKQFFS